MIRILILHARHKWAVLRGDPLSALKHMEAIMALNFDALQAAADAIVAKDHADETAAAAAQASVDAAQAKIDAITAELTAAAPAAASDAAPAASA